MPAKNPLPTSPARVRIHLNLAQPERAECAVKIQSARGGWVTVGYSTHLQLKNCIPIVDHERQEIISRGEGKKTPHAFIEGDLVAFKGRVRPVAPATLVRQSGIDILPDPRPLPSANGHPVNYNPRFARCFYLDQPTKDRVDQRLDACGALDVLGWSFMAHEIKASPLQSGDLCPDQALALASKFEKQAIASGLATTRRMLPGAPR